MWGTFDASPPDQAFAYRLGRGLRDLTQRSPQMPRSPAGYRSSSLQLMPSRSTTC